jgi:hypothetical protein
MVLTVATGTTGAEGETGGDTYWSKGDTGINGVDGQFTVKGTLE